MNTRIFTRAALLSCLLALLATAGFAQSNDIIDAAKGDFQNIFMDEMAKQASQFSDPPALIFPCKGVVWDQGIALIAALEGTLDLSNREFLNGADLMFVYLSQEVEEGQVLNVPNGFYTVSLRTPADGTNAHLAQFKNAQGVLVAEVPVQMSQMIMPGAPAGVDVGIGHNEGTAYLNFHWTPGGGVTYTRWLRLPWYWYIPPPTAPTRQSASPRGGEASGIVLEEGYPNPFNPTTTLRFSLPETMPVTLRVYDLQGRAVATLVEGVREAGTHTVQFDGTHLASGTYLYRLEAGAFSQTKRFTLVK
jgi:hypothetical protein